MMKKRLVSVLLVLAVLLSVFSFQSFAAVELLSDDFESYAVGQNMAVSRSVYLVDYEWTEIPEGCSVQEEEVTGNQYLKISSANRLVKSWTTTSDPTNFSISFSVNTRGNGFAFRLYEYGKLTRDIVLNLTKTGEVQCTDESGTAYNICNYDLQSWNNFRLDCDVEKNHMWVYMNDKLLTEKFIYRNPPDPHQVRNFEFIASLGSGQYVMLDNVKIEVKNFERTAEEWEEGVNWKPAEDHLDEYRGVHPRLFIDQNGFDTLKQRIEANDNEYVAELYRRVKDYADNLLTYTAPDYYINGENLWINDVGDNISPLAFMWKITGERKYLDKAWEIAEKLHSYPAWSATKGAFNELASRGAFYGSSILYDWCYHDLSAEQRYMLLSSLAPKAEQMANGGWWRSAFLQNHSMHGFTSAFMAACVIYDEYPQAENIMYKILGRLKNTVVYWPRDGFGAEGPGYYEASMRDVVLFGLMAEKLNNINVLDNPVFKATTKYPLYQSLPVNTWTAQNIRFGGGDATTYGTHMPSSFMALLADRFQDGTAQWYVNRTTEELKNRGVKRGYIDVLTLLFYNPDLEELHPQDNPEEFPLDYVFTDTGYVYLKEDWSGDEDAMMFHCGPIFGYTMAEKRKTMTSAVGAGHQHPDANSIQLYSNGEWLFADDGYTIGYTKNHSGVLINGYGQVGEPGVEGAFRVLTGGTYEESWHEFVKRAPKLLKTEFTDDIAYVAADALDVYFYDLLNLTKVIRHYIYIKSEKTVLIIDELAATEESEFSVRFRPKVQTPVAQPDGSFVYAGDKTVMNIKPFVDKNVEVKTEKESLWHGKDGAKIDGVILSFTKNAPDWTVATAVSWQDKGMEPANVDMYQEGDLMRFAVGNTEYIFDTVNYTVATNKLANEFNVKVDGKLINKPTVKTDGTILADASAVLETLGAEGAFDTETGIYTGTLWGRPLEIKAGSDTVVADGVSHQFAEAARVVDGVLYAPTRMLAALAGIGIWYDEALKCAVFDSKMDMKNTDLFELAINGEKAMIDANGNYYISMYGDSLEITPVPKEKAASYSVSYCDGVFGTSKVTVTSADGSESKQYNVTTRPMENIGNLPIHNIITPHATRAELATTMDNSYESAWAISGSGFDVVYDFGSPAQIDEVLLSFLHGATRKQHVAIAVSDDNVNYTTVFSGTSSGKTMEAEAFSVNRRCRYVKLIFNGTNGTAGWNNTSEIGFNGSY